MKRPRLSSLVCALALVSVPIQAQRLFDIGIKGGVNSDDLRSQYGHSPVLGGHAGLFARIKPPILPGAQGELLLTSIGTRARVEGYEADVRTLALQVPLFAVFAIGPVELHGGGYYERYLSERITDIAGVDELAIEGVPIALTDLNDDGYGLLLGMGLHLKQFYAGVRYNMGLDALGTGPFLNDVYNRQVQAYIGLGFVGRGD